MRLRTILIIAVVGLIVLGGGVFFLINRFKQQLPSFRTEGCAVKTTTGTVGLSLEQTANAATISAVGLRRRIPDQGIVVALAAALQESKLENLDGGDRDSVGLFQQRPSQGWGRAEQLRDPRFAADRFYSALLKVPDWQGLRVTEAAQRVQRSAYPEAYQKWADEAEVLAAGFIGRVPNSVTCTIINAPTFRGQAAAQALRAGLTADWGKVSTSTTADASALLVNAGDTQVGWQYAHWIVAHSADNGVARVRFGGQEWSAESGAWAVIAAEVNARTPATTDQVVAEVFHA